MELPTIIISDNHCSSCLGYGASRWEGQCSGETFLFFIDTIINNQIRSSNISSEWWESQNISPCIKICRSYTDKISFIIDESVYILFLRGVLILDIMVYRKKKHFML